MIGSSRTGSGLLQRPRGTPARAAISNASADGVDVVVGAVDQRHLEVDTGKPASTPDLLHRLDALLDRRDVLLRHRAADDLVLELEALAGLQRLDDDLDAGELARAAGLLLVRVVDARPACVIVSR